MKPNEANMNQRSVERESGEERRVGVGVLVGGGGGLALQDGHLRVALDTDLRRRRLEPRLAVHLKCERNYRPLSTLKHAICPIRQYSYKYTTPLYIQYSTTTTVLVHSSVKSCNNKSYLKREVRTPEG